jgi:alcohol dehydrogenase (NADP+)
MTTSHGYAAHGPKTPLAPFTFERRAPRERDVMIDILYCGVCHSDIHQVRDEWGGSIYPMVPGHEIVGRVTHIGAAVTKFRVGDLAGVGVLVDSCRTCASCKDGLEQFCQHGWVQTYNSLEKDGKTPTYGGYSDRIVVDERFTLKVSSTLELSRVAPLLCAGITTYSPLRHWNVGAGQTVGIVGLGGLGHMGVKFARSFGAEVVVFTTSADKKADAVRLGAHEAVVSRNREEMRAHLGRLDFILNTVAAVQDLNAYLELLRRDGTMVLVGLPMVTSSQGAAALPPATLIFQRRQLAGSLIGGLSETQEMLDYCAAHGIGADVEVIPLQAVNDTYDRMLKGEVKYRSVIDLGSLRG